MATQTGTALGKTKEAMRQEAIQRYDTVKGLLARADVQKGLKDMMRAYANRERLFQVVLNYVRQNDALLDCSQSSLLAGIVGIFKLGLDPTLKQVHLVPFWNTKKKMLEATLIPDFRGKIALMKRAGEVIDVTPHVVYEKDSFECLFGTDEYIKHIPSEEEDPGKVRGAYVIVEMKDGKKKQDYMPVKQIEKRMEVSKTMKRDRDSKLIRDSNGRAIPMDGSPWKEWFEEQCLKTVVHHISKYVPMSVEEKLLEDLDTRAELGETQLDILPGTVEAILTGDSHELPEEISPVVIFDQKAEKLIASGDRALWEEYLNLTAGKNQKSVDEIKAQFKDDFEGVVLAFGRYKERKKPAQVKPEEPTSEEVQEDLKLKGMIPKE